MSTEGAMRRWTDSSKRISAMAPVVISKTTHTLTLKVVGSLNTVLISSSAPGRSPSRVIS